MASEIAALVDFNRKLELRFLLAVVADLPSSGFIYGISPLTDPSNSHDSKYQKADWRRHKEECNRIAAEKEQSTFADLTRSSNTSDFSGTPAGNKPTVLIVTLDSSKFFESSYSSLLSSISDLANIVRVTTSQELSNKLASPSDAVLILEPTITERKYVDARAKLVLYTKAGGTVVFGGSFSSFIRPNDMTAYFKNDWNLPWKTGSYHRTTFSLNPHSASRFKNNNRLVESYSMKALHVSGSSPDHAVYMQTQNSKIESHVFAPTPVENMGEYPVTFAQIDSGFVGYIGDVNAEDESMEVYLTILGLRGT